MTALDGRVCVVTGAARGIGKGIARRFLQEGATVWLLDIDGDECARTAAALASIGDARSLRCDVTDRGSVREAADRIAAESGNTTVLVNNAGVSQVKPFLDLTEEDWTRIQDINLKGTFLCCQAFIPQMMAAGGGSIVNIASVNGLRGQPVIASYGASKAGIINLTKTLALEFGPRGIRANSICPATTETEMTEQVGWDPDLLADLIRHTALGRLGTIDDVANAAVFLAGDQSSFVTGTELVVDGGLTARQITTPPERLL